METYISFDIETSGPCPGIHEMMSLGAVAIQDGKIIDEFEVNILPFEDDYKYDDKTGIEFWDKNPDALNAIVNSKRIDWQEAIRKFFDWKAKFKSPVLCAYPAGFDFSFLYYYATLYKQCNPDEELIFSWSCLDMKTMAATILKVPYHQASKKRMPKHWFEGCGKHTHIALDDAREQGILLINMMKDI